MIEWRCCLLRCMSPLMADIVAKRFFASRRVTLIQAARPLDSKVAHLEGAADFCNKIGTKRTSESCHPAQVRFAEYDHMVQSLLADRANEPLNVSVLSG